MKAPVRCPACGLSKREKCPVCKGAGFILVDEDVARKAAIRDVYKGRVKPDE